jgi:beta-exotoxin I transport system permease protein
MHAEVALLDLRLRRRAIIGYTLGLAVYALVIVILYPQFKDTTSLNSITEHGSTLAALFGATGSLTSPTGWLNANLYANFVPLIVLLVTIGYGASSIAGQDEAGTLSLVTILPVSRRDVVLQKAATLVGQAIAIALATMLCVLVGRSFDLSISIGHLAGVTIGVTLLGIDFGLAAVALGAWSGTRGLALGVTSTIAAASYLISSLAPVVGWIRPAKYASLFYWAVGDDQLANGLGAGAAVVLVLAGAALLAGAVLAFERLDLH